MIPQILGVSSQILLFESERLRPPPYAVLRGPGSVVPQYVEYLTVP